MNLLTGLYMLMFFIHRREKISKLQTVLGATGASVISSEANMQWKNTVNPTTWLHYLCVRSTI